MKLIKTIEPKKEVWTQLETGEWELTNKYGDKRLFAEDKETVLLEGRCYKEAVQEGNRVRVTLKDGTIQIWEREGVWIP